MKMIACNRDAGGSAIETNPLHLLPGLPNGRSCHVIALIGWLERCQ